MILAALGPAFEPVIKDALSRLNRLPVVTDPENIPDFSEMRSPVETLAEQPVAVDDAAYGRSYVFAMGGLPQTMLDRTFEYRWDAANRLGRRPAMQFLGPGEETVSIRGTIYPPYFGSFSMLQSMRAEAMAGTPRPFVTQYGEYHGIWCIRSIRDNQGPYWPDGYPRKVEFTIELTHYGPDGFSFGF